MQRSLRRGKQFANLDHTDGALAEQMISDGALPEFSVSRKAPLRSRWRF